MAAFFQLTLESEEASFADLVDKDRAELVAHASQHAEVVRDIAVVPLLPDVTRKHALAKTLRGVVEGAVGDEAFKLVPKITAMLWHPLHVKVATRIHRPLTWNGGQLMEMWKLITAILPDANLCDLMQAAQARALLEVEDDPARRVGDKVRCTQGAYQTWPKQKLAVHAFSVHCIVDPVPARIDATGICYACMVKFGSRLWLRDHVLEKGLSICRQYFLDHAADVEIELFEKLEELDREIGNFDVCKGPKRSAGAPDCLRFCGPHPRLSKQLPGFRHPLGIGHRWHAPLSCKFDG